MFGFSTTSKSSPPPTMTDVGNRRFLLLSPTACIYNFYLQTNRKTITILNPCFTVFRFKKKKKKTITHDRFTTFSQFLSHKRFFPYRVHVPFPCTNSVVIKLKKKKTKHTIIVWSFPGFRGLYMYINTRLSHDGK